MKPREWAARRGVSCRTALYRFRAGSLPVGARQLPAGAIVIGPPPRAAGRAVACCRVPGADQGSGLGRQAGRVAGECGRRGVSLGAAITETGSGLDGNRVLLRELLAGPDVTVIAGHRDRLAWFGAGHLRGVVLSGDQPPGSASRQAG